MQLADEQSGRLRMMLSANPTVRYRMEKGKRGLEELKQLLLRYLEIAEQNKKGTNQ
jgi:hypothetical protein